MSKLTPGGKYLDREGQSPLRDAIEAVRAITEAVYDPNVKKIDI